MLLALLSAVLASENPQAIPPAESEKPRLICRKGEQIVGTHMRTGRRCKTAEEWQLEDAKVDGPVPTLRLTGEQNDGHPLKQPQ
jgi:hypothetical protein